MRDIDPPSPFPTAFPATLPASMDFAALLDEGIRYAQKMSHDDWTDYNEHDPGLTILEQLCYALTDLGMRGHYPVEDLLADPRGRIQRGTLFSGARILAGAPQTAEDYRHVLIAHVDGVKNFWLAQGQAPGLYEGAIEVLDWTQRQRVKHNVERLLRANRMLGEEVASVLVLEQQHVWLDWVVVVASGHDADEVMAAVLFALNRSLVPALAQQDGAVPTAVDLVRIVPLVRACFGVQSLETPHFADLDGLQLTLRHGALPFFAVPGVDGSWPFKVHDIRGHAIKLDPHRVDRFMTRARVAAATARSIAERPPEAVAHRHRPTGQWRDVAHYHSLQHQFPVTYGLSHYGVPSNLDWQAGDWQEGARNRPERLAQARQLCAYLLLFEQMLANGFSQLAAARTLFSVRPAHRHSYFSQPLVGRTPRPQDAPLARSVLPDAPAPVPAPPPQPPAASYRYLVDVLIPRHAQHPDRRPVRDRVPALSSARFADRAAADRIRQLIAARGSDAGNYAVIYQEGGTCTLALMAADATSLAHGHQRYRSWDQASVAAVTLARHLRNAQKHKALGRYLLLRRQPAVGMRVFRHGQLVLSAWWQVPVAERAWLSDRVLRLGSDPANYRLRRDGDGWRCDLYDGVHRIARGHLRGASEDEAWELCREVAALLRHIGHEGPAYLRHVELLPDDAWVPARVPAAAPVAPDQYAQHHYQERLQAIVAGFDDFPTRRQAFLDHLLARFDTGFDDALLQSVEPRPANRVGFLADLASWKSSYLAALPHAGARRGSGRDVARALVHEMPFGAGLEHQLFSLLGIGGVHDFARYPLSRPRLARRRPWYDGGASGDAPFFAFWNLPENLMAMLLKYGTDQSRYAIRAVNRDSQWRLYFIQPNGKQQRVLEHDDSAVLAWARDRLIAALLRDGPLWQQVYADEGLYVVEHILLRSLVAGAGDDAFYPLRITVLFPAWPLRFRNVHLRALAESLLAQNAPAHLAWECHWLEFAEMRTFEDLYARWSMARREAAHSHHRHPHLDGHALALRHFIEQLAPGAQA